jgi:putative ABC transport system permease protein
VRGATIAVNISAVNGVLERMEVRYALRSWAKAPGFAITAIGTLAIGNGASTAIFSVVSGVLLRPLPFSDPQKLVQLYETQPRSSAGIGFDGPVVFQDFEQWRTQSGPLEALASYFASARNYQAGDDPEQMATVSADRGLFRVLGVAPSQGRTFDEHDPLNVAVASAALGKKAGSTIALDAQPYTVIGVMPPEFRFPYGGPPRSLWVPWEATADLRAHPNRRLDSVVARLKPGIGVEAARQQLNALAQGGRMVRVRSLRDVVTGSSRQSLLVLFGAVGMVLLVACVNVANLLLARTAARAREIATRAAIGARPMHLVRQFLTESLVLAAGGGILGLVLATAGTRGLLRSAAAYIPRATEIGMDWRVFAFLLLVSIATGSRSVWRRRLPRHAGWRGDWRGAA